MKAIIFGATGMVGGDVLRHCLSDSRIDSVVSVGRRETGEKHPKLNEIQHEDYLDYTSLEDELSDSDLCLFCIGVYQNQVPREIFWEVTVDYLSALISTLEKVNQEVRFCLFSAQGAKQNEKTPIVFSKAKGRAERLLFESKLKNAHAFRPGFIKPGGETAISGFSLVVFNFLYGIFPRMGIDSADLARAMVDVGIMGSDLEIFENRNLRSHMMTKEPVGRASVDVHDSDENESE